MKVCSHCKVQNSDSANYCRQCGFVFPHIDMQSVNKENSLIDKVNELQKRISDAESNSNSSQREIKTLNSRVSSLVSSNSSLQDKLAQAERQLFSAISKIDSERQKAQNAQEEADNAKKTLAEVESSKSTIHVLYIIALVVLGITAFVQCNGNQNKESEISSLNSDKEELINQVSSLKSQNATLSNILEKVGSKTPLFLGEVCIRNEGEQYNSTIYSRNTTYINPKIEIFSLIEGNVKIYVKLITPFGLSQGKGKWYTAKYTYSDEFYLNKNQNNTCELSGWGNTTKGQWSSGDYRYEFYYNGKCIGSKSFTIY